MPAHTRTRPAKQAPAADPPSVRTTKKRQGSRLWLFLVPALALYAFVVLVPSGRGAMLAFTDWDGLSPDRAWIGLDNFTAIFDDADARSAVWQTLLVAVAITIIQNAVGLLLALGVNSRIKSRNVLRVFLFAPAVMTPVVVGALWKNLLAPDGAVNWALDTFGLSSLKQDWLGDPNVAIWSVVGVVVWQFAGYSMVIFLAGLQGIPQDVYEAADIDGAGPVRRFRHVVFPLLAPATTINLMLSIIGGLKLFDQVWVMTGGGPGHSSETLSTLIYKDAFQFGEFAYSIALAIVLTIFVAIISSGQYGLLRRQEAATS
ncbi:carbohydrate ABC transporter permease [Cryptosporangium sp. NPDC048952]|uniref:carbohydrate ABC transporter permease n=1 Tax=Cryptosporangium sp. NPDC048952 TaxID=3363961 RepID=UPI00370FDA29